MRRSRLASRPTTLASTSRGTGSGAIAGSSKFGGILGALAGVLGLFLGFLGWQHLMAGMAAGFVIGGLWGLLLIISRRGTIKSAIPFGPPMLAGTLATMLLLPA